MAKLRNKDVFFVGLLCILCVLCGDFLHAQTPATTTVKDTVYRSDGSLASGTVVITWPAFVTADAKAVFGGTKTLLLTNGALAVALAPNSGGTPSGSSYNVKFYQSGGVFFEETWVVPTSSPVATPAAPTSVTQVGTAGTTTYYYWVSATNANGETLLGPSRVTTTSNATLSMTNYNVIAWDSVSGATGYRVWRTTTSTAPTGTGNYLVGSTASTTINDQSNTLTSAAVPTLNTTDPRTLSQVRVTAAPSSTVTFAASQVQGTAIVSNPSSTQTITAPPSGIPLQVKGRSGNSSNVLEVYDNAGTPALRAFFSATGAADFGSAASLKAPTNAGAAPTASGLIAYDSTSNTLEYGENGTNRTLVNAARTLTGGAGIAALGDLSADRTIATASGEAGFLVSGALTCGAGTAGAAQVHTTPLQYCDNSATPALRYAAYGDSAGAAQIGDSATNFFSTGNLELARLPIGTANQILGTDSGATAQEHKTLAVGTSGTDFAIAHAANSITFNLPSASATARGAVTTAAQTFAGNKTFTGSIVSQTFLSGALVSVTFSATPTFDAGAGNSFKMTLTANVTSSTISNPTSGEQITLLLCQDGTGSRTMTWPTTLKLAGGSFTLTTTANKCDSLTAVYDGSNWYETARTSNL